MPDSTNLINTFDTLGRLKKALVERYGELHPELADLLMDLQDEKDLDTSKIETLTEMNQEANDRVVDERARSKATERKLQRSQMEVSQLKRELAEKEAELRQKEEVIAAYKSAPVRVEAGGIYNNNQDSNVLNAPPQNCEFKAGNAAAG